MNIETNIEAVNFERREALLSNGQIVPITNFFSDAEEVEDYYEAVSFVCGTDNLWFSCLISDFETMELQ